jgi:multidrug efflux pump subunit AcrB
MNLATLSLNYRLVTVVLSVLAAIAGVQAYQSLGRLEDPAFPIKQAVIITAYPGATAEQVADEVTDEIESAIQQLDQIDYITSQSQPGQSIVKVYIRDRFSGQDLPQIWDELRRKVGNAAAKLPPGAGAPFVNDDFGDVYGLLFYLHGDGFTLPEIYDQARQVRDELLRVPGVASVSLLGEPTEAIYLSFRAERLVALGADVPTIVATLEGHGLVVPGAQVQVDDQRVSVRPTGTLDSVAAIESLPFTTKNGVVLRISDIAQVTRDIIRPPGVMLRFNDYPAIAIGVSAVPGVSVVDVGDAVRARIEELKSQSPIGMEYGVVSMQSDTVRKAVAGFTLGLVESVVIVVGTLLFTMGMRAGVLIGGILLLTILGTFVVMQLLGVELQRVSLGALIIALGMLVDNAIVVVEGMLAGNARGMSRADAARAVVGQTTWPLAGATLIAILAFAPIGLSPDSTGDYCQSLFIVIAVSLGLSWLFAVTSTPVFGAMMLRTGASTDSAVDPYGGRVFRVYRALLEGTLRHRGIALIVLTVLLTTAVIGFGKAKQGFFPASSQPQFLVDVWTPQGSRIESTDETLRELSRWLSKQDGVVSVAQSAGAGTLRYQLTYGPESANPSFGQLIVAVERESQIDGLTALVRQRIAETMPDVQGWPWRMVLGPGGEAKIQARFRGSDPNVLRQIASQVESIMAADAYSTGIRSDWRNRVVSLEPAIDENRAASLGITSKHINRSLELAYDGTRVGLYREGDQLLPIMMRSSVGETTSVDRLLDVPVFNSTGKSVPLEQVAPRINLAWQDPIIARRDRALTLTVKCDPGAGPASSLFQRLRPQIEAIPLPQGYSMEWGGEYENSAKASRGLIALLPLCFGGMALILLALFNNIRQPLVITLTVPLAIIGVTIGLLVTGAEFGFMPILGVLSLTGMLIKNSIVLIDEANAQRAAGKSHYDAIVISAVSRTRPVVLAAVTTVLGMIPLLTDVFFKDMAIVIIFGLSFATLLTLIAVPLLYVVFYNARPAPATEQ